jgi:hypothetical protein
MGHEQTSWEGARADPALLDGRPPGAQEPAMKIDVPTLWGQGYGNSWLTLEHAGASTSVRFAGDAHC